MQFSFPKAYRRLPPAERPARLRCESLEDRAVPATLVGLTTTGNLVTFDSATPGTIATNVPVTGLQAGETLVGIDYRPSNGQLVGVGSTNRLYLLSPSSGAATQVGTTQFTPALSGSSFGLDFNPAVDKIRVVSNTGQNLRLDPTTGLVVGTDTNLTYDAATYDAVVGGAAPAPQIVAEAYTKNADISTGKTVTTLYAIDSNTDLLSTQGAADGDTTVMNGSPNSGVLFPVGALGFDAGVISGFDIETATDAAYVVTGNKLYTLSLTTGAGTLAGTVGGGLSLADVTVGPPIAGAGALSFAAATATFPDSRGPLALTVTRSGGASTAATVNYATSDGTGVAGVDYAPNSGTLSFAPGQTSQTIFLSLPGGPAQTSPAKTLGLTLSAPTGGATLGATPGVTITIPAVTATQAVATKFFATGAGQGGGPQVNVYNAITGASLFNFTPFESTFTGGVTVATGDVNGDGTDDIVVGTGVGGAPRILILDGATRATIANFFAYEPTFTGGVNVATGDVNGDGFADVLVGSGVGGGPRVRVLSGDLINSTTQVGLADFFAYENTFRGGVNVGAGTLTGGKFADIIAGAGFGGAPRVRVFSGDAVSSPTPNSVADYFAYDPNFRNGVNVASGDVNGDGRSDVITGAGVGGGPDVRAFSGLTSNSVAAFFAYENTFRGGVRVAATDFGGDGVDEIVTAGGPGRAPQVKLFNARPSTPTESLAFNAYDPAFTGGVFVG